MKYAFIFSKLLTVPTYNDIIIKRLLYYLYNYNGLYKIFIFFIHRNGVVRGYASCYFNLYGELSYQA